MKVLMLLLSVLFSVRISEWYCLNLMLPLSLRKCVGGGPSWQKHLDFLSRAQIKLWPGERSFKG